MARRTRIGLVVLWAASIVATGAWVQAQAQTPLTPAQTSQPPTVLAGSDLGFRVERHKGDIPVGTLVARVNGQWVEVEFATGVKRLTAK